MRNNNTNNVPGIPDDRFVRGAVPMTKEEVRTVTISKLRPEKGSVVWDIGAGTGSLSVEAARLAREGRVYAVERLPQGVELIEANRQRFQLDNIEVVAGTAPGALAGLPDPDRVIVGGSGGELSAIMETVKGRLTPGGVVVINCVTVETLARAMECLRELGFQSIEGVGLTVTRLVAAGNYHRFDGGNPVFILSGKKE
ncbi:MAG: precorrin-6Y C5,15-methyltransferase (decarboxylating) subunit CbiT [Firmicutes bacterium]|nr:precorrin-6Y C5,15-methyltransferase (decarboxylating) subunit CbiT [Bacillota bacterium]